MQRKRAVELAVEVLTRLCEKADEQPFAVIDELYVFGPFARGALEPGDLDLNVEIGARRELWLELVYDNIGQYLEVLIIRAVRGSRRSVSVMTRGLSDPSFDMVLLWRRGDSLQTALGQAQRPNS